MPNLQLLNQAIADRGLKQRFIAGKMGITEVTLSNKLNGNKEFTVNEANALSAILLLSRKERDSIFFDRKVI